MARFVVENGHQHEICFNETILCAQNIDTNLGSIVNTTCRRANVITSREQ